MTFINKQDYFPIGTIVKPHGLYGGVIVEIEDGFEDSLSDTDSVMVEVEGGLVPFFVSEESLDIRTSTSLFLIFEDLDSADKVRPYIGCKIYLHHDSYKGEVVSNELNELIGFTVFDKERGKLGNITRIDNFSGNVVLTIQYANHEILIPFSEELIVQLEEVKQELHLDCPDGLIDLYLE